MSNDQKHKRPKFSLEFKQDAAQLVLEKGDSHQQAAEHLGISLSALGRWVRAERKPLSPDSVTRKVAINLADHDELTVDDMSKSKTNQSCLARPNSSISTQLSAPQITAQRVMKKISCS